VALASLLGSATAFLAGRVHLRARLRRVIVAGTAFFLVIIPASVWAGVSVRTWLTIDPHDESLHLGGGRPMADGKWALVSAQRNGPGPFGAHSHNEDWAVNLETGVVRDLGDYGYFMAGDLIHSEGPGKLVLHRPEVSLGNKPLWLRVVYDLNEGRPLSTRTVDSSELHTQMYMPWGEHRAEVLAKVRRHLTADGRRVEGAPEWSFSSALSSWGVAMFSYAGSSGSRYGVLSFETGEIRQVPSFPHLLPDDPDGYALAIGRPIRRMPLGAGEVEEIDIGKPNSHCSSNDRKKAIVTSPAGMFLLRSRDGSVEKLDGVPPYRNGGPFIRWAEDSGSFLVHGQGPSLLGVVTEDGITVTKVQVSPLLYNPVHFDGRRILGFGKSNEGYFTADLDGGSRQLLPVR
jgi:hypothetical protein